MGKQPFFSIVLPTFNRADFVVRAIDSVLNQTFVEFELIIVDDGSTDNTQERIATYNDPRIIYHYKTNEERNYARNKGIALANGQYINFLDSDDYLLESHLEEAYKNLSVVKTDVLMLGFRHLKTTSSTDFTNFSNHDLRQLPVVNNFHCSGAFIKKDCFDQVKFIESKTAVIGEDRCLWMQLASRFSFRFSNAVTSVVEEHDNRSINTIDIDKLIQGKSEIITLLKADKYVSRHFGRKLRLFASLEWSLISNFLSANNRKKEARKFLYKAIKECPESVFYRRTIAAVKNSFF